VSNARASLLLKILKAEDTVTPLDPGPAAPDGDDHSESPGLAA